MTWRFSFCHAKGYYMSDDKNKQDNQYEDMTLPDLYSRLEKLQKQLAEIEEFMNKDENIQKLMQELIQDEDD